jgi:hypothetical protein
MDSEIKKSLASIKRRQAEIDRQFGRTEDDGPLFGRRHERRHKRERDTIEELFDDVFEE